MQIAFLILLALIIFIYFGYPVVLSVLVFLKKEIIKTGNISPSVTLIIPAYNEQAVIRQKIENSFFLEYPKEKLEIILALDGCTDKSKDIALNYINKGLKIIEREERGGKIAALNKAVSQSKNEILIFSDANSIYEENAIINLVRNFADKKVGCVCGELKYTLKDLTSVEAGENLYWKYEKFLKEKESKLGSLLVTNGSIYAIKRELYSQIDEDLADDFVNPMRVYKQGFKVVYEPDAIAYEKVSSRFKDQFDQKVRIISQGWKATFRLWDIILSSGPLRIFEFLFHKFLRWIIPFFLIAMFISNLFLANIKFYQILLLSQVIFYVFAFIGYFSQKWGSRIKLFYIPFYFCMVNATALLALFRYLKGGETKVWEKAQTSRS
ncbi:glycosyltransferase family 2 protein [bacterium]|jgi:cellulose synthase/poly-beta-1,6-N-acetylglucosamine synthase-like glycosyltransferase|nr:glycosyltransferase family 2 protein [bacterium]